MQKSENEHDKKRYAYFHRLVLDQISEAKTSGRITSAEERVIIQYITIKETEQISQERYYKIAHYLLRIRTDTGLSNYLTCSTLEVQTSWNRIKSLQPNKTGLQHNRRNQTAADDHRTISANTITDMQRTFKAFIIWLSDTRQNKIIDARAIELMKPAKPDLHTVTVNSIIPSDDLQRFFNACSNIRDIALFRVLYAAALRIGEICSLKIKDVYGIGDLSAAISNNESIDAPVFIETNGKTGFIRKIPITDTKTKQALFYWLSVYPGTIHQDAYLFPNRNGQQLTPSAVSIQIERIAKKAGISRHLHAHLFRHTRITELSRSGLNESHIKRIAWGHQSTPMLDVYSHLTPDDTAAALIKLQEDKRL